MAKLNILNASAIGAAAAGGVLETGADTFENAGAITSGDTSLTIATSAGANTKGAFVELIASTANAGIGVMITIARSATNDFHLCDLAIGGAGSEVVIVPNMLFVQTLAIGGALNNWFFPISIPAGSRLSFRNQSNGVSETVGMTATIMSNSDAAVPSSTDVAEFGAIEATTQAPIVTPNHTVNTKSAWVELTSSLERDITQLYITTFTSTTGTDQEYVIDIGTGAAASEVVLIPDVYVTSDATADRNSYTYGPFPCIIAAGTRISFRAQSDISNTDPIGVNCHGV